MENQVPHTQANCRQAVTYRCRQCWWEETVRLISGEAPAVRGCPHCGSHSLVPIYRA